MIGAAEQLDLLVTGGGKAGKTLAMDLARAGATVAMVEQGIIGGSCINVACIPLKALVTSARAAERQLRGAYALGSPLRAGTSTWIASLQLAMLADMSYTPCATPP